MRRAVFLDRDGVLNRVTVDGAGVTHPPQTSEEVVLVGGAVEACSRLKDIGFELVIVTNQPDVRRGTQSRDAVDAINDRVSSALGVDHVLVCFHDDGDACECRKPNPGLLIEAARRLDLSLTRSYMIGDRETDVEAGRRAGCCTIRIGELDTRTRADFVATSLWDATERVFCSNGQEGR